MSLVKELQIDKGVFPVRSKKTNKFSAFESYKENLLEGNLPSDAPKDFKEAIPYLYYAPEERELISYKNLHHRISEETERKVKEFENPTEENKKQAHIESSKKVLKEYHINDKTLLIYSPKLLERFQEEDEFYKISATYNHEEKIIYIKTERLKKAEAETPHTEMKVISPQPEKKVVDVEELKKKYQFQRPKTESMREMLNRENKPATVEKKEEVVEVKKEVSNDPLIDIKNNLSNALHVLAGKWENNTFKVNFKESGYLLPIEKVELDNRRIFMKSSSFTNIEWWTKFNPIDQCPRFMGALHIDDEFAPYCKEAKCVTACGADDGFVELSAARFRLMEDSNVIRTSFKRLQEFLDRALRLANEFNQTFDVDIKVDMTTKTPFFYAELPILTDSSVINNYIEAFMTLYPEITDIRGKIDIDDFIINEDFDTTTEEGLVQEGKTYGLQEMVRMASKDLLEEVVKQKGGSAEGKFYLIDHGKMRYVFRNNRIEALRDELYMGNVTFKKGIKEVEQFLSVTLGGGRW
jgi:hypothetical protein